MSPWRLALLLVPLSAVAGATEIAGIKLDERAKVGESELVLNGAGLRRRVLLKVYVAGLYLAERRTSPAEVLALAGAKRLSITLLRNLPARKVVDALKDGIGENSSPAEQQALEDRVEDLAANLLGLGQGMKGDVITFDWLPAGGTVVALNGEVRGNPIPGDDVYRALLRVWLGDRPTSGGLKNALLGRAD